MYNRSRLAVLVFLLAVNASCSVANTLSHRYPIGLSAVLFLLPALHRELALKQGRSPARVSPLEWSCFLTGTFFLVFLPLIIFL
jgi:hypothetical protein